MATNLNFNADSESNISSYTTAGQVLFTENNLYLVKADGNKIKYSSIEVVSSLPTIGQPLKIYILSTNFSLNYYDTSWHLLGGSDQISTGITAPTDTNKLFLDITDKTKPILKYYNNTTTTWESLNHYHSNIDDLNKIGNDGNGNLTYNNFTTITADSSNCSNGKVLGWNNGKNEYLDINVGGIVGSAGIVSVSGSPVTILAGNEATFLHPSVSNDKIMINVQEQISSSSITDTHVDFNDSSKYNLQDNGKIMIENNKAKLDIYTKLLMHMDDSTFKDECGHAIINNGVTINTTNKKFGTGSAYFNGNSCLYSTNVGYIFSGDFEIDFWIYTTVSSTTDMHICQIRDNNNGFTLMINGTILHYFDTTGTDINIGTILLNTWTHIAFVRYSSTTKIYINEVLSATNPTTFAGENLTTIRLGNRYDGLYPYIGYIDEFRLVIGNASSNYISPISAYNNPYLTINTPTYLKTTGNSNFSLTTIDTITSLTIPVTIPTNTSCKCLVSFDNGTNWLYRSGGIWNKYTGDITIDWTSSNSTSELQTYFNNISLTQLTSDLSSLGIMPICLDFCFQLNTQTLNSTPFILPITLVYKNVPHTELASFGSYEEQYVKFGVKRVSNTTLAVKNLTSKDRTIAVNVLTGN